VNSKKERIVFLPLDWNTHAGAMLSGNAQDIINKLVLDRADIVIAIFKGSIGTRTKRARGGTVEEIKTHHQRRGSVMLYFCTDVPNIDLDQKRELEILRKWAADEGLYGSYKTVEDFAEELAKDLQVNLDGGFLDHLLPVGHIARRGRSGAGAKPLSPRAHKLLKRTADSAGRRLVVRRTESGILILVDGRTEREEHDPSRIEECVDPVAELQVRDFLHWIKSPAGENRYIVSPAGDDWLARDRRG
jgi:hypothetical protein